LAVFALGCGSSAPPARDAAPAPPVDAAAPAIDARMELPVIDAAASAPDATVVAAPPLDAAPGAPPDGGAVACTSLFCEDFEGGQIDPARWSTQTSGGHAVMIEQTKVAHGKYAAQFHAPAGATGYDFLITRNAPAALKTHHFGRAYVMVAPKLPVGHTGLMFAGSDGFPRWKYLEIAGIRGGWQLSYVTLTGADGETDFHLGCAGNSRCVPDLRMAAASWLCVEWEFNDQPDQITLSADGKPVGAAPAISFGNQMSGLVGGFTSFGFGFYDWHPDNFAFDVYYDDLALDTRPIGCL
jgi:hypothetical protein